MSKFGNKKVEIDGTVFDSVLEGNVYLLLKKYFVPCEMLIHKPVEFAPATKRYPAWSWKVDFQIPSKGLYIEAKGVRTRDWQEKLRAIDQLKPEIIDRLIVVSSRKGEQICKGLHTVDIPELARYFERFKQH